MEKGTLVEFKVNGDRRLAVIEKPEGKKDWIAIDKNGTNHKVRPQKIDYLVKGESFKPSDIEKFSQEVEKYLDPSSLEVAWELLMEESTPITPPRISWVNFFPKRLPSFVTHLTYYCLTIKYTSKRRVIFMNLAQPPR